MRELLPTEEERRILRLVGGQTPVRSKGSCRPAPRGSPQPIGSGNPVRDIPLRQAKLRQNADELVHGRQRREVATAEVATRRGHGQVCGAGYVPHGQTAPFAEGSQCTRKVLARGESRWIG